MKGENMTETKLDEIVEKCETLEATLYGLRPPVFVVAKIHTI